jgi:hypothetical protein
MNNTTLKLKFQRLFKTNLDQLDGINTDDIQRHLAYLLNEDSDGRYPFDVELFLRGLRSCLIITIRRAIEEKHQKRYPQQYIYTESESGSSSIAKWVLTSEEVMDHLQCYFTENNTVEVIKDE